MFWMVIDAWIRDLILVGPDNDTSACRVRARFRSLLPDPHAALDFAADLVLERVGHWAAGRFDQTTWKDMERRRGLAGIASSSFVRLRALSALRHRTGGGVVGLPADGEPGWSLDAGVEGGFDLPVETARAASETAEDLTALLASLEAGRPVLRLHAPSDRIGAVLVTASLQLLLRLVPDDPTNERAIEAMDREAATRAAIIEAHRIAAEGLEAALETVSKELFDHPGMEPAAVERLERRLVRIRADLVVQPLAGGVVADLLGLATTNAGEQRNSKYRARLGDLLPELAVFAADEEAVE